MHRPTVLVAFIAFGVVAGMTACSGSSSSNPSPTTPSGATGSTSTGSTSTTTATTKFEGTIAGTGSQSGTLSVTIQGTVTTSSLKPLSVLQATGTLAIQGGSTVSLTGSVDTSTNTLSLSGSGFTLTGTLNGTVASGTYTAPGASGGFSSLNATQSTVTVYCGTYHSDDDGIFNIEISTTGALSGSSIPTTANGSPTTVTGTVTGSTFSATSSEGVRVSGSVQNGSVNGTFTSTEGRAGSLSGTQCGQS